VLRELPDKLPASFRSRLAQLGQDLRDPLRRLRIAVHYNPEPSPQLADDLIAKATGIPDEEDRGEALNIIGPVLPDSQVEAAFMQAGRITEPNVAGKVLARMSNRLPEGDRRQQGFEQALAVISRMDNSVRRFDALALIRDLPPELHALSEKQLFDLAVRFEDPNRRCLAMYIVSGFARDEALRTRALLAGLASAEAVRDEGGREELLMRLRPAVPSLPIEVRRELTRVVERTTDIRIQDRLRSALGRYFVYERDMDERRQEARERPRIWDVFICYSRTDGPDVRLLAAELKSRGLRVFLDEETLDAAIGTSTWLDAIDNAIAQSRAMLVLLTVNTLKSKWAAEEWKKFYRLLVERGEGYLFTLRIGGPPIRDLPLTLQMYQCVESQTGRIESKHINRIMDIVRGSS
jgi:hypothetical protein